jgi:hypothetical protein
LWQLELSAPADSATLPASSAPSTSVPSINDPPPPRYRSNPYPEIANDGISDIQNVGTGEFLNFQDGPLCGDKPAVPDVKSWLVSEVNRAGVYTYVYIHLSCPESCSMLTRCSLTCAGNKANREIFLVVDDEERVSVYFTMLKILTFSATGQLHRSESCE